MYNRRWHGIKREKLAKKLHTHTYTPTHTYRETLTHTNTLQQKGCNRRDRRAKQTNKGKLYIHVT